MTARGPEDGDGPLGPYDGDEDQPLSPEADPHIYGTPDPGAGPQAPRTGRTHARRGRTRHPWRMIVLVVVVVVLAAVVGGVLWVRSEADPSGPAGPEVLVTVGAGTGANQLSGTLASKGVIGSSFAYRIWSQIHSAPDVLTGEYAFRKNSSFAAVNDVITAGPNVFPLTIPPGFTVSEVSERVGQLPGFDAAAFDKVATDGSVPSPWQPTGSTNLDGLLGTGTYTVVPGETDIELLTKMVDRFNALANALDLTKRAAALGLTPYQAITVASIVEKEGVIAKNLGPVARTILNRLANDMPLQMDSTVLYALGRDGGTVTSADLEVQSPYNTYRNKGLTPTPICFPSEAALEATLDPPAGAWLYFVVVESDGTEAFSDTFAQQQTNEALAQQRGLP